MLVKRLWDALTVGKLKYLPFLAMVVVWVIPKALYQAIYFGVVEPYIVNHWDWPAELFQANYPAISKVLPWLSPWVLSSAYIKTSDIIGATVIFLLIAGVLRVKEANDDN
jgi:hypothetical protein